MRPSNPGLTAVLDIGSSKIVCVVLGSVGGDEPLWAGLGVRPAEGITCGEVAEPSDAQAAIASAIADAERSAGRSIASVILGVSCGRLATVRANATISLDPTIVRPEDIKRLLRGARVFAERGGRYRLHDDVLGYRLDQQLFAAPPMDRFGRHLDVELVSVTADAVPVRRLIAATEASGVPVVSVVPLPVAAAMAVTTPAERVHGVTVVDCGAGLTSITSFAGGRLMRVESVMVGGRQITQDVAAALQVSFASAERIKHEYASVHIAHAGVVDASTHRFNSGSNADMRQAPDLPVHSTAAMRGALSEIASLRIDNVLRHVADHLDAVSFTTAASGRVVLTGGGSSLSGLAAYAAQILGCPVRLGRPPAIEGLGVASLGVAGLGAGRLPSFAAIAGLAGKGRRTDVGRTAAAHMRVA